MGGYKSDLRELVNELGKIFAEGRKEDLVWTEEQQEYASKLLAKIAGKLGSFDSQKKNEEKNIKEDLTVIDTKTNKKIELVNIASMKDRVENVLASNNDLFSALRALAIANKCAHKCDDNCSQLLGQIQVLKSRLTDDIYFRKSETPKFDVEGLSHYQINKILDTLDKGKVNRGAIISVCKLLNIELGEDIKERDKLQKIFSQLQSSRNDILSQYIEKLKSNVKQEEDFRKELFWVKDQYIAMIGQLLTSDSRYSQLDYEMVKCGEGDFEYMLSIDYPELSYYIEVHMPNFLAHTLEKEHGISKPVDGNERKFEKLGASAVYDREDDEIEQIKRHPLDNARRRILSRPRRKLSGDNKYLFNTRIIQTPEDRATGEGFLTQIKGFEGKAIEYSKKRSDEKATNIEVSIAYDVSSNLIKEKDRLTDDKFVTDFKNFARTEIMKRDKFDKVLYMYANDQDANNFIVLMSYQKVLKDRFKQQYRSEPNLVEMIDFIQREYGRIKVQCRDILKAEFSQGDGNDER